LVEGMALRIQGGEVEMAEMRVFECADCGHVWEVPFGAGRPTECPACQSNNFHRAQEVEAGAGGGRGRCMGNRRGGPGRQGAGQGRGRGRGRAASKTATPETKSTTDSEE
jgi:hypothetical protein